MLGLVAGRMEDTRVTKATVETSLKSHLLSARRQLHTSLATALTY